MGGGSAQCSLLPLCLCICISAIQQQLQHICASLYSTFHFFSSNLLLLLPASSVYGIWWGSMLQDMNDAPDTHTRPLSFLSLSLFGPVQLPLWSCGYSLNRKSTRIGVMFWWAKTFWHNLLNSLSLSLSLCIKKKMMGK